MQYDTFLFKGVKKNLIFLKNVKFLRVRMPTKDNYNQNNTSHITIKELIKRMQLYS